MTTLFEHAQRAGQAPSSPNWDEFRRALAAAQAALLQRSLVKGEGEVSEDQIGMLRHHAEYLDVLADEVGAEQSAEAHYIAGTIAEWLATLEPGEPRDDVRALLVGPLADSLRAVLHYSAGRQGAASRLAGGRVVEAYRRVIRPNLNPITAAAADTLLHVLARQFRDAIRSYRQYSEQIAELRTSPNLPDLDWPIVGLLSRVAEAAAVLSAAMLTGAETLFTEANRRLERAHAAAGTSGHADVEGLIYRLQRACEGMGRRSTLRILRRHQPRSFRLRLMASTYAELWSSQVDAIEAGMLDTDRSFVLALPTGAGKSSLAHFRIAAQIDSAPDSWVAFVVPSRALVRQVHRELSTSLGPLGIRVRKLVASAEASLFAAEEEGAAVASPGTCVVLTPERLDLYVRARPELLETCSLLVVDEAHFVEEKGRGPRLEGLVALARTKWPQTRILLLSAMLPNIEEFAAWLGAETPHYWSDERATRQIRGLCVRYGVQPLPELFTYRVGTRNVDFEEQQHQGRLRKRKTARQAFRVGAIVVLSAADVPGRKLVGIPDMAQGESWFEVSPGKREFVGTSLLGLVAQVAETISRHPGLGMVFLPKTEWTETVCSAVARELPEVPDCEPYARAAAQILGPAHPLVSSLKRGCAFHHARLPEEVLRLVEHAAEAEILNLLCATSGLQAGVNVPASIVLIVGEPAYGNAARPTVRDFANMAGRAGRPRWETDGLALYFSPAIARGQSGLDELWRRYLLPSDSDLEVRSALSTFIEELVEHGSVSPLQNAHAVVQQLLLGLYAADLAAPAQARTFFANTLALDMTAAIAAGDLAAEMIQSAEEGHPELLRTFAKTALPYATCLELDAAATDLIGQVSRGDWPNRASAAVARLADLLFQVEYFRTRATKLVPRNTRERVQKTLAAWSDGTNYEALAHAIEPDKPPRVEEIVRVLSDLSSYYAWGAGALISIARTRDVAVNVDPMLPYYLRFGVNSPVAAYLRLIGVSNRAGSSELAAAYPQGREVSLVAVEDWTRGQEGREAVGRLFSENRLSLRAIEADLGLEPTAQERRPERVELPPQSREIAVGTVFWSDGEGSLRDPLSGATTAVRPPLARGAVVVADDRAAFLIPD